MAPKGAIITTIELATAYEFNYMLNTQQFTDKTLWILGLCLAGLVLATLLTPIYTRFAYKYNWWKRHRTHSTSGEKLQVISMLRNNRPKRNVPLMAGLVTIVAVGIITLLFNLDRRQTWLPLAALVGGGFVGLIDDIINIRGKGGNVAGLRAPIKFGLITLVAAIGAVFFYWRLGYDSVYVPVVGDVTVGWLLIPLFMLVIVSTSNAVNISDGVDGLAGGLLVSSFSAFATIAFFQEKYAIAAFCATMVGALLSYLYFNIAPARFFMGDVGSFGFGTALGVVAMMTNTLLLLPIIGLLFVVEAGSSLLQIFSKKVFHRKIFIAAPIHHHLEAKEWPRTKITMRFWVIGQIAAIVGVILALATGYV